MKNESLNKIKLYIYMTIIVIFAFALGLFCLVMTKQDVQASEVSNKQEDQMEDQVGQDGGNEQDGQDAQDGEDGQQNIVVVIDPGHGGTNAGASPEGFLEKDMTLKVAKAMRDELNKYEGIDVYLTREDDVDMSLKERVDFAEEVNADFLFCLHFNMSETHELYGAECWVSMFDTCYAKGYDFSKIEMEMLTDLGLYDRGIKTRENSKGTDYYGIIRIAKTYDLPAVIIEHCHLDHANDASFIDNDQWLERYGVLDATAVARYYGLKSEELGVDYSSEVHEVTPVPDSKMAPDETPPEVCDVSLDSVNEKNGEIEVTVTASDADSRILYYKYSLDGGITYSEFLPWEKDAASISFTAKVKNAEETNLIVKVVNLYGFETVSDTITMDPITYLTDLTSLQYGDGTGVDGISEGDSKQADSASSTTVLKKIISVILIIFIVLSVPIAGFVVMTKIQKKR